VAIDDHKPRLYPIPFTNEFTVASNNNQAYQLQLFSLDGKLILEKPLRSNYTTIETSALASGLYFAKILDHQNVLLETKKIVKN
jgi:hypothetical protein